MSLGQRQRAAPVFQPWPPRKCLTLAPSSTRACSDEVSALVAGQWCQREGIPPASSIITDGRITNSRVGAAARRSVWTHTGINQQSFFFFLVANLKHVYEMLGCGDQIVLTWQTHGWCGSRQKHLSGGCFYLRLCTTFGAAPWLELELEIQYSNSKRFNILLASSKPVKSYFCSFSGCRVFLGLHESIQYLKKKKKTHRQMPRGLLFSWNWNAQHVDAI